MIPNDIITPETAKTFGDILPRVHIKPLVANFLYSELEVRQDCQFLQGLRGILNGIEPSKDIPLHDPRLVLVSDSAYPEVDVEYHVGNTISVEDRSKMQQGSLYWEKVPVMYCPDKEPQQSVYAGIVQLKNTGEQETRYWIPPMTPMVWKAPGKSPVMDITPHWYAFEHYQDTNEVDGWEAYRLQTRLGEVSISFFLKQWRGRHLLPFRCCEDIRIPGDKRKSKEWAWIQTIDWLSRLINTILQDPDNVKDTFRVFESVHLPETMHEIRGTILDMFMDMPMHMRGVTFYHWLDIMMDEIKKGGNG